MTNFGFINEAETLNVNIRGNNYPVIKSGTGIPCLIICLGTPSFRTISKKFSDIFEIYSSDVYWITRGALENIEAVTIEMIIDDIKALGEALGLKKYVIFAHSAYGIIALEFAKKYPEIASGILMVGTPVNSNSTVAEKNSALFEKMADPTRKVIDAKRRAEVSAEDLTKLSTSERWQREYIYRDAPRYWHIPDFDCTELWVGLDLDRLLIRLFTHILPRIDVLDNLNKVKTPVFLAAGLSDYDCCPWLWQDIPNLPENFVVSLFRKSGHWPHYEEHELFDARVASWVKLQVKHTI